ncbi:MAG: tyrosine--tRNA ligase, partial [Candidatus Omnitrophica bacterium]|nr:tyrosine--tRNA ligase [Candidatus Omnitrophota bacterium]
DIHLGHVVLLRKLRKFQDLGHQVIFLIGDFTAQVGDPTGRDQLRPKMDQKTIAENAKTYKSQVFKILDEKKTQVVFNSEWLKKLGAQDVLELTAFTTVAQMLARADFKKRFEDGKEISLLEFLYPLLQGYDSVHLKADIELGGQDQKFNLLMGRQLQEAFGQEPQSIVMTPLIEGTDGVKKMSKSLDNYIGINEHPRDIFGKVMSINDGLMLKYYECLTDADLSQITIMHPKEAKLKLAQELVEQFYDSETALSERELFENTFAQRQLPPDAEEYSISLAKANSLLDVLVDRQLVPSKKEARRLLLQGAISFEGEKISDEDWTLEPGMLKVGKRRFLKLTP